MLRKVLVFLLITSPALGQQYDSGGNLKVGMYRWNNVAMSAALALADNTANPTAPPIGAYNLIWDGATWDRWTGSVSATNLDIRDLVAATDSVSVHGDVGLLSQFDLTSSDPATVAIVDANGDQITSFGGGTQYNQGTATTDTDTLTMSGAVRRDTAAVATGVIDGDRLALSTDSAGRLRVSSIDLTQPISAASLPLPTGASTSALQDGIIKDGAGDTTQANVSSGRVHVDGSGVTQPVSGTVTVTDGAGALNVIVDSGTVTAVTDITNPVTVTDGAGALNVIVDSGTVTTVSTVTSVTQNADVRQATASNLNAQVVGSIAHDSADSGNPVKIGYQAISYGAAPTAVAAADRVNSISDRQGVQFVLPYHPNTTSVEYLWTSAQTDDALVAVSAGTRIAVVGWQMTVASATTVSTAIRCGFGTSTLPAAPTDGNTATGIFLTHVGVVPGAGVNNPAGAFLAGADDEDLRCTTGATTNGTGKLVVFYFTFAN